MAHVTEYEPLDRGSSLGLIPPPFNEPSCFLGSVPKRRMADEDVQFQVVDYSRKHGKESDERNTPWGPVDFLAVHPDDGESQGRIDSVDVSPSLQDLLS